MRYIKDLKHFESIIDEYIDSDMETEDDWEEQEDEEQDIEDMIVYCIDFKDLLTTNKISLIKLDIEESKNHPNRYNAYIPRKDPNKKIYRTIILYNDNLKRMYEEGTVYSMGYNVPKNIYFTNHSKKEIVNEKFKEQIISLKRSYAGKLRSRQHKLEVLQREIGELTRSREYIDNVTLDKWLDDLRS